MSVFVAGALVGEVLMMLQCHFSWQGQYLVRLQCQFSWQGQYFLTCLRCSLDESHWQGCVNVSTGSKSWQGRCSRALPFRGRRGSSW